MENDMKKQLAAFSILGAVLIGSIVFVQLNKRASSEMVRLAEMPAPAGVTPLPPPVELNETRPERNSEMPVAVADSQVESAKANPVRIAEVADGNEIFLARFNSKLMDNSELEEFIRSRLWLALDQLKNPLIASLNLTPAETEQFKNLIVSNLAVASDQAAGQLDDGPLAVEDALEKALAANRDNFRAQVAELLGETRFGVYEAYQEDYGQFNRIKFLPGTESLSDAQAENVLETISNERQTVATAAAFVQEADASGSGQQLSPSETAKQQQAIKNLIAERACEKLRGSVSAEQLIALKELQEKPPQTVCASSTK
jgi:hypothetical protein